MVGSQCVYLNETAPAQLPGKKKKRCSFACCSDTLSLSLSLPAVYIHKKVGLWSRSLEPPVEILCLTGGNKRESPWLFGASLSPLKTFSLSLSCLITSPISAPICALARLTATRYTDTISFVFSFLSFRLQRCLGYLKTKEKYPI